MDLTRKWRTRLWLWLKCFIKSLLLIVAAYGLVLLIGLIPLNNNFEPASDGVLIYVTSNSVHADVIVPVSNSVIDWRQHFPVEMFAGPTFDTTHVAFGWGDQGFFVNTPSWDDLTISTAANALLIPSNSCMHVVMTRADWYGPEKRSVSISIEQYQRLTDFIQSSFLTNESGQRITIPNSSYGDRDKFFQGRGTYHALNTCNSWVGRALKFTGVRVPWLTPMPKSPMLYLPEPK